MSVLHGLASTVGKILRPVHAGEHKLVWQRLGLGEHVRRIDLRSPAFVDGATIPREHTTEGANSSPPLWWDGVPEGTRELVLLCEDPDAPFPRPLLHWAMYGLDPAGHTVPADEPRARYLAEPAGAQHGRNSLGHDGYDGPAPPPGHGPHRYCFQLFALDAPLLLDPPAGRAAIVAAMRGHVIGLGRLIGTYAR